jgi:hypothetical protein
MTMGEAWWWWWYTAGKWWASGAPLSPGGCLARLRWLNCAFSVSGTVYCWLLQMGRN